VTIAPWNNKSTNTGDYWITGTCGLSEFQDLEDFGPSLKLLFEFCDNVWIYGAQGCHCNPSGEDADSYYAAITEAMS